MRTLVLAAALGACGGSSSGNPADGGGGSGSGDGAQAAFCDGTLHDIGPGIVNALAIDAHGRLLAVGTRFAPSQQMFVERLLPSGAPDPAFGDGGTAVLATGGPLADGHAIAVRADGTIVAGGGIEAPTELKPFVYGLSDAGQPTALSVTAAASQASVVDRIFEQGPALVVSMDGEQRRITAAGAFDATFGTSGSRALGDAVAVSDDGGLVVAVNQVDGFETFRATADGADLPDTGTTAAVTGAWATTVAMSRANRITFVGTRIPSGIEQHAVVGRVLADDTWDVADYPPNGVVDLGALDVGAAVERADGSLLLAGGASGIVVLAPDGTIDRTLALAGDLSLKAVADWSGHAAGAGTLSGGRAFVACFP